MKQMRAINLPAPKPTVHPKKHGYCGPLKTMALLALLLMAFPIKGLCSDSELLLGLVPEGNIFTQMKRHHPIAEYLSTRLGINVRLSILSKYSKIIPQFEKKSMDGALFGIYTSILAEDSLNLEPLVRPVSLNGKTTANGYIFVRTDSGIENIHDLKGKRAVFVDHTSATGYLYLISILRQNGISNPDAFFATQTPTGSHEGAVYAVHSHQADVGVAKGRIVDDILKKDQLIKDELKIISISPDLPDNAIYISKEMPMELRIKIRHTLIEMNRNPEGKKILETYGALRFTNASSSDLEPVREMARQAGKNSIPAKPKQ